MKLKDVLKGVSYEILSGDLDKNINEINYDSRKIKQNDLFVCIKGYSSDGHKYACTAIEAGAKVIICEDEVEKFEGITVIRVENSRKTLAIISSNFYDNPEKKLKIYGITGTNGKTTSTFILKAILSKLGYKVGLIGTIANYIGDKKIKTERTTPESLELFKLFKDMINEGVTHCVMEVSSHSLDLYRVQGVEFHVGIFTNLTQDHLDFHKSFENYFNAKKKLFNVAKECIINNDDIYGKKLINSLKNKKIFTYSIEEDSDLKAYDIRLTSRGATFTVSHREIVEEIILKLPGKYNVYNALGCILALIVDDYKIKDIKKGIESLISVPGRCEIVSYDKNLDFDIIIDYAHTPDGVLNVLKTAREFTNGKLMCVVGCGGDRDKTKRPIMGRTASDLSDVAYITSDNPRSEEPQEIINDIVKGIEKDNFVIEVDRKKAITLAIKDAKKGDVIVIAGKGHEDYQILNDRTIDFDERIVVNDILKELKLIK